MRARRSACLAIIFLAGCTHHVEEAGPPELPPRDQNVRMRLRGGRTGKRAVICERLESRRLLTTYPYSVPSGHAAVYLEAAAHMKFAASFGSPAPLYRATSG